jgi:hypothetical protein
MSDPNSQSELPPPAPAPTPPPPPPNRAWIGFFAFLLIASIGVTVFMIWFNQSIQLTPDELTAARKLWEEKGPKSYNMVYTEQINDDDKKSIFFVKVRNQKVEEVLMNGKPLEPTKEDGQVHDPRIYHSMDAKFRDVERLMDIDQRKGAPKVYVIANFDPATGAILRYIRRVMGTTQRIELNVKLEPADK